MTLKTKLKVDKLKLVREVRDAREKALERYERDLGTFPERHKAWLDACEEMLVKALDRVQAGKHPVVQQRDGYTEQRLYFPQEPTKPKKNSYTCKFDQRLDFLGKAAGDTITLDISDYEVLTEKTCRV